VEEGAAALAVVEVAVSVEVVDQVSVPVALVPVAFDPARLAAAEVVLVVLARVSGRVAIPHPGPLGERGLPVRFRTQV